MENSSGSFIDQLRERRFFQFFLSYLVAGWGILQFMEWLVGRYALSPAWVDVVVVFLLSMLPSVALVTYFHGRPGRDRWQKVEKIFLPTNLLLAIGLIAFLFSGQQLKAMSTQVTVTDEAGNEYKRFVPKKDFTKRITVFPAVNQTGDSTLDWTRIALSNLLGADLNQDLRLNSLSAFQLLPQYEDHGYSVDSDLPLAVQQQLAEEGYSDEFLTLSLQKQESDYSLELVVYQTRDGKERFRKSFRHPELMALVDLATVAYVDELSLPDTQVETSGYIDLPASNLFTQDLAALKLFQEGVVDARIRNKPAKGIAALTQAVQLDPNFAEGWLELGRAHLRLNDQENGQKALETALERSEALPERQQFLIRYTYYTANMQMDKAIALLEMWRQLYPSTYQPYEGLVNLYLARSDFDKAREISQDAMKAGHSSRMLLLLAQIASVQGKNEEAIEYYEEFSREFPNRAQETSALGDIYLRQGDFEKAKEHFSKINLLKPNDHAILGKLAEVAYQQGDFAETERLYEESLRRARSLKDSSAVLNNLLNYHYQRGQGDLAIQALDRRWRLMKQYQTPFEIGMEMISYGIIRVYYDIGRELVIREKLDQYFREYPDQTGLLTCAADINYYIATEDRLLLNSSMAKCEKIVEAFGGATMMTMVRAYQAKVNGNYVESTRLFETFFNSIGTQIDIAAIELGENYRLAGNAEKAIDMLTNGLKNNPYEPSMHFQLGLSYRDIGKNELARQSLETALDIWKEADPEFKPAIKAREALAKL